MEEDNETNLCYENQDENIGEYEWPSRAIGQILSLEILMPNGLLLSLSVNRNATLHEIKDEIFEEASKHPLHWALQDRSTYIFRCIVPGVNKIEHCTDESKRLLDVNPFKGILRLQVRKTELPDERIENSIQKLIGVNLDELKNSEITDFRWRTKNLVEEIVRNRKEQNWLSKMLYMYPPRIVTSMQVPKNVQAKLRDEYFVLIAKFQDCETTFKLSVQCDYTPIKVLQLILNKKSVTSNSNLEQPRDFVLKVCGRQEYLLGDIPIINFRYIQDALAKDDFPTLITVPMNTVPIETDDDIHHKMDALSTESKPSSYSTLTLKKKGKYLSSWDVFQQLMIKIINVNKLNCEKDVLIGVTVGLYHGNKPLCSHQKTVELSPDGDKCTWDSELTFQIQVCDIPRSARLCFVVFETSKVNNKGVKPRKTKDNKQDQNYNPIAWVNTTIYDFKSQLQSGNVTLYMWNSDDIQAEFDLLNPLGTVVSNPDVSEAVSISIAFQKYDVDRHVMYPAVENLTDTFKDNEDSEIAAMNSSHLKNLEIYVEEQALDPFHEYHDQELKVIWGLRQVCLEQYPQMLPKVLECVNWNNHKQVSQAICMLRNWTKLPPEKALELLDYAYPDQSVRKFAVHCLEDVCDEDLSMYLLQLVQAIKHESYLYCDLVEFLLKRALNNKTIGHYLFWHLRSDMTQPSVNVRFGLILEAYCHGALQHLPVLARQVDCLNKFEFLNEQVRMKATKEKQRNALHDLLREDHSSDTFTNLISPLEPSILCKKVLVDKCRVMDSKMKPLWVVFENDDQHGGDYYIIYKNGDDLRQDMFTLQMLRMMDRLWKSYGYDFRMNPYNCISTDNKVGLIEVVLNAETIANIQKEKGVFTATSAFRKGSLLAWLKDHNPTDAQLNNAVEEFTYSCAGYCVATYVLGIADRHSDNIMVKKNGQLFHIDFGHILGHFKEKFGFRRERVPFVLTHDFVHVINKGQGKEKTQEFKTFQELCERAFMILRQHGSLILSLFAMMISTGLPELSSEKDLNYLQDTLVLDKCEEEAIKHFRSKFDEALSNSWKTSLNWASHNLAKNNKQ